MKKLLLSSSLIFILSFSFAESKIDRFTNNADAFLKKHVKGGLVDYKNIKAQPAEINKLVEEIKHIHVSDNKNNINLAFYINAYNILVISSVVKHFPISSPMDVDGFFDKIKHQIGSEQLSLNDIENNKIRAVYHDAHIHFVLVCAAKGCPKLMNYAYRASNINQQLDARAKATINDATFTRIKSESKMLILSEIFKWYREDFVNGNGTYISYVNAYLSRDKQVPSDYEVSFYPYNWKLNIQP